MSGKTNTIEDESISKREKNSVSFHSKKCNCCGKSVSRTCLTGVCRTCRGLQNRKCTRPTRDVLFSNLMNSSFSAVGRMYSVSDNAVRKWCKSYNLPTRTRDIKLLRGSYR